MQNNRREFFIKAASMLGVAVSATSVATLLASCEEDTIKNSGQTISVDISGDKALETVGGVVAKTIGGNSTVVVRASESEYVVLSRVCSHQGCTVSVPANASERIVCPCHLAEFNPLTGAQVKEPNASGTRGPLKRYASSYNPSTKTLTVTL
ncbi:MAG: Rieske (2Fe-2S) protein [Candidatus Kapabacteria bacterium]|nr:Rieske (2Fe-2S) protein [Candidatus Kapabacteria bacterium]